MSRIVPTTTLIQVSSILGEASSQNESRNVSHSGPLSRIDVVVMPSLWSPSNLWPPFYHAIKELMQLFDRALEAFVGDAQAIVRYSEQLRARGRSVSNEGQQTSRLVEGLGQTWRGPGEDAFASNCQAFSACEFMFADSGDALAAHAAALGELAVVAKEAISSCALAALDELVGAVESAVRIGVKAGIAALIASGAITPGAFVAGAVAFAAGTAVALGWFLARASHRLARYYDMVADLLAKTLDHAMVLIGSMRRVGDALERVAVLLEGGVDPGPLGQVRSRTPDGRVPWGKAAQGRGYHAEDRVLAELADNAYVYPGREPGDHLPEVPPGYTRLEGDPAALRELGLDPSLFTDHGDGFTAALFRGPDGRYVVAFVGTELDQVADLVEDANGAVTVSPQLQRALDLSKALQRSKIDDDVVFTGHSLGGRLAAAASAYSGNAAVTWNAAGVSDSALRYIAGQRGENFATVQARLEAGQVRAYSTGRDPLTNFNDVTPIPDGRGNRIYLSDRDLGLGNVSHHLIGQVLQEFDAYPRHHPDRGIDSMVRGEVAGGQVRWDGGEASAAITPRQPASAF